MVILSAGGTGYEHNSSSLGLGKLPNAGGRWKYCLNVQENFKMLYTFHVTICLYQCAFIKYNRFMLYWKRLGVSAISFKQATCLEINCVIYSTENTGRVPVIVIKYNLMSELIETSNREHATVCFRCVRLLKIIQAAFPGTRLKLNWSFWKRNVAYLDLTRVTFHFSVLFSP